MLQRTGTQWGTVVRWIGLASFLLGCSSEVTTGGTGDFGGQTGGRSGTADAGSGGIVGTDAGAPAGTGGQVDIGGGDTCAGPQDCQACNDCGCVYGLTDSCGNGCSAVPPPDVASYCEVCNYCGDCNVGVTDACGYGCDAPIPPLPGPQSCEACNDCGYCNYGSTDECGYGCDATAPDDSDCC